MVGSSTASSTTTVSLTGSSTTAAVSSTGSCFLVGTSLTSTTTSGASTTVSFLTASTTGVSTTTGSSTLTGASTTLTGSFLTIGWITIDFGFLTSLCTVRSTFSNFLENIERVFFTSANRAAANLASPAIRRASSARASASAILLLLYRCLFDLILCNRIIESSSVVAVMMDYFSISKITR